MSDLIERLNVPWESSDEPTMKKINRFIKERKEAAAEIARLRGREEEYRKALKPFASIADMDSTTPDGASTMVNISRCRDAARALFPTNQKGDQDAK